MSTVSYECFGAAARDENRLILPHEPSTGCRTRGSGLGVRQADGFLLLPFNRMSKQSFTLTLLYHLRHVREESDRRGRQDDDDDDRETGSMTPIVRAETITAAEEEDQNK